MRRWHFGTVLGVQLWFTQRSLLLSGLLWLILGSAAAVWLDFTTGTALILGFAAVCLHWAGEIVHQLGHAWVARRLGFPMARMVSWMVLLTSRYPKDEPPLQARIHIKRALGGPSASLLVTALSGLLLLIIPANSRFIFTLTAFVFVANFLVFFLGAFLPLGFTDGSTLLTWWPKRNETAP